MGRHGGRSYGGFKEGVVWRWSNWFDDNLRRVVGDGGEGGEAWKWIQMLFAWEEEILGECCALFHDVLLQVDVSDR
ncbi:hypothetical protein MtrunA17_Chr4g0008161 [Medicago truncatula]|uniref:Uncharacterized protein n=1 Tax=Medicago truncatula TaxID=3880 RepID=A0A396I065_MEDTR|nr:hypothetical protein MtrunA17_Chr4g0008161 [Medicago truncatula]